MGKRQTKIRNKEVSWLSFNSRLLQEAADPTVPLLERLRFLGIFSSNLDEFFRVRVATLKRLERLGKKANKLIGHDPKKVLKQINDIVVEQQATFESIYEILLHELEQVGISIVDETELTEDQTKFVRDYFEHQVRPKLIPIMLDQVEDLPGIDDESIYLAVALRASAGDRRPKYALIKIPTDVLPRFVQIPGAGKEKFVILLDDVIRTCLVDLFSTLNVTRAEAYTLKVTRDAELDIEDDISESFIRKVSKSLEKRKAAMAVRFVYDGSMPDAMWRYLLRKFQLQRGDSDLLPGGRYHNFKDFVSFPDIGGAELRYRKQNPLAHKDLVGKRSILQEIEKRDVLLHYPYQSFDYIIDMLREASIDPEVTSIKVTLYRVARRSNIVNALINAAKNGKAVTAVVELQARFDEKANIKWADRLQREGVRVIHGVPGLKVHAKLLLITRQANGKTKRFASIGTGNLNESTARQYSDHSLLTADPRLTGEIEKVFEFIETNFKTSKFKHLLVSPFNSRAKLTTLINREIKNAKKGEAAYIIVKINNLTDTKVISKLYDASEAGVDVVLMVRGMFSPVIGVKGMSEHIEATGLIDRYLEHSRILAFCNGGDARYYLSSADLMPRNLDRRVEVAFPIYDEAVRSELEYFLDLHRRDSVRARLLTGKLKNRYRELPSGRKVRAQDAVYNWLRQMLQEATREAEASQAKKTKAKAKARSKTKKTPVSKTKKKSKISKTGGPKRGPLRVVR